MELKRVVVTGIGALTPIGNNIPEFWNGLISGKNGVAPITRFNADRFRTRFAAELKQFNPNTHLDRNEVRKTDPFTQYALVAAAEAIKDSGFDLETLDPYQVGVIWGSGQGGMQVFEEQVKDYVKGDFEPRFNPFFVPKLIVNMASGLISIKYGFKGINFSTVSACATSNTAIMDAFNYIRLGKAKIIITGGSEAPITEASVGGFCAMKAMSARNEEPKKACRPFDRDRDGFVMGEGAGALILEEYEYARNRGAHIYAEVAGAAMTADAYHMTSSHPEGEGALMAMKLTLEDAGISAEQVDYINPHATSTPVGDLSELKAINKLYQGNTSPFISGTKSMTGHLLGAAGAVEAITSLLTIKYGIIPPTINTENPDPEIPAGLRLVFKEPVENKINIALSNAFGFGGHNASLLFRKV
jgi:3-oxoacyl-[acyl-carrier-protein] synthase II